MADDEIVLDFAKPMHLRAEMARRGLMFVQLLPYDDPEHGYTDPFNSHEVKVEVRRFMGQVWEAALRAEASRKAADEIDRMAASLSDEGTTLRNGGEWAAAELLDVMEDSDGEG